MLHFAEFGVVLMLFLVGLELEPRRLWAMRRPIFGWGSVQLLGSALLMFGVGRAGRRRRGAWRWWPRSAWRCRPPRSAWRCWPSATSAAPPPGQGVLSVALLQDIAAIPILALVPLLAVGGGCTTTADRRAGSRRRARSA